MPAYGGMWTLSQVAQAIKNSDWTGIPPTVVEYLIVAGGGGAGGAAGSGHGGGGGAGGLLQGYAGTASGSSYTVTIGGGGAAGASGQNSVFGSITATGGGFGGSYDFRAAQGGSGGGGAGGGNSLTFVNPGSGISGQGNAGGIGAVYIQRHGGGGGGAGAVGLNSIVDVFSGNGGAGIASTITGTVTTYSGGGGGGGNTATNAGVGGAGGGGPGGVNNTNGTAGTPNTGGGGGGGGGSAGAGGAGGSGIVVIRYPGNVQYYTGGTLNYSNGYIVHTFYSSGTLAPTTPRLFASPDYQISRSLRFNSADGTIVDRAGGAGGNRQTWTWSGWVKRSKLNTVSTNVPYLFGASDRVSGSAYLQWGRYGSDSDIDSINFNEQSGGAYNITTEAKFRDMSAWYHVVCAYNTTQSVASDRVKIYVNGVLQTITSGSTYPPQNTNGYVNYSPFPDLIGAYTANSNLNITFDGYMTEINFVDGQQLTPASFGYTESSTGVWTPLQYTGSYGTRGYYVNFADNSNTTAATLGKDLSGNANNFTPTNFSVTAGAGNDSLVDVPTPYGVDTGVGGEVRGNYCTWNPLSKDSTVALSNGNLDYSSATNADDAFATMGLASGKWYFEFTPTSIPTLVQIGVATNQNLVSDGWLSNSVSYRSDGQKYVNGTASAYGATFVANDVIGVAVDIDNNLITFYKNNVSQGAISYTFTGLTAFPVFRLGNTGGTGSSNFGQRPFAYTAPSGYRALCTQNLPESGAGKLPGNYFGVATYTGNGSTNVAGPFGFQPDLAWTKSRSATGFNILRDSVRGSTKRLISDGTYAELDDATYGTFTYNGLNLGSNVNHNASGTTYVAWAWNAGGTTVTNTVGTISAQVSANPSAGFSIVTYTGNATTGSTVGHGLGAAPNFILVKLRSGIDNWYVYHSSIGATGGLLLNTTNATITAINFWNNTVPTSSVFSTNSYTNQGISATHIAYCWAEVAGYSRFGSYTGNGAADGPFVHCGFRPRYVMYKCSSATGNWITIDTARDLYNVSSTRLLANTNDSEASGTHTIDILSNGFKLRNTDTNGNSSATTYIFAAYAESPFKYARAR
jgi:hypothetical protein